MGGRDRVAVWAAVPYVSNVHLGGDVRHGLTYLPSVVGFVAVTFDLWLWKLPWVSRITGRPHLYGTWRGTLMPSAESQIPPWGQPWTDPCGRGDRADVLDHSGAAAHRPEQLGVRDVGPGCRSRQQAKQDALFHLCQCRPTRSTARAVLRTKASGYTVIAIGNVQHLSKSLAGKPTIRFRQLAWRTAPSQGLGSPVGFRRDTSAIPPHAGKSPVNGLPATAKTAPASF